MVRHATKPKGRRGSLSRPGMFDPEPEPNPADPTAADDPPPRDPETPRERLVTWPHPIRVERAIAVEAVMTEPDYAMPFATLAAAVDCLKPEQLPRLAAVLLELLRENLEPPTGEKWTPPYEPSEEPIPW